MQIMKHRTVAIAYPWLSLEAEVLLSDGRTVYTNISVNDEGEKEDAIEDCYWTYTKPLDKVDLENPEEDYADVDTEETKEIVNALINMWNENPVFTNDLNWKNVEA